MSTQIMPPESVTLPLLPLRDVVVFPHMVIPLFVGRPKSIKALEAAMEAGKSIMLVAQKNAAKDEPTAEDIYEIGCVANILQMLKLPDGTVKVLVEARNVRASSGSRKAPVTSPPTSCQSCPICSRPPKPKRCGARSSASSTST